MSYKLSYMCELKRLSARNRDVCVDLCTYLLIRDFLVYNDIKIQNKKQSK